jgi:predicted TIM-barrel fold metal-dependent hydrolase
MAEGNERVRAVIEGHPELHGYAVIHPGYPEQSLAQLRELLALPNFVGAKLHPKHCGYQADAPEARPLLEYLVELGKPLLVHTWFDEMCLAMGHAADLFPDLTLIMGHMGGDTWETALTVAADRPNLYLELCSGLSPWGKLEKSIGVVGAERLLYGSDLTLLDPGYTLGLVTGAEIGEAEKRLILHDNAQRLFGF